MKKGTKKELPEIAECNRAVPFVYLNSVLFTWVMNGIIIAPKVDDTVWKWVLRACAFLICFLGHLKLTVWDEEIKDRFFE